MEQLLKKAKIQDAQIKSLTAKVVAKTLSSLAEPCYYPDLKKYYYEYLKLSGLTEKDVREFSKRRWKGRKEAKFATQTQPLANFYVFLIEYFLKKRDKTTYQYLMAFYVIRHYANLMHKHFTYCNDDTFKYALETLTKTHLFAREKTIANALYFMAQQMINKWTRGLRNGDLDSISAFMQESRHRVSQSIKSFAQTYYKASEEDHGIKAGDIPNEDDENSYQQQDGPKANKIIDDVTKKITIYRYVDRKGQEEARALVKISASLATQIVGKLNNPKHADSIRLILKLFIKDLKNTNSICGKDYYTYVRQLMSLKRTRMRVYFKQQVNLLLLQLIDEFGYGKTYYSLTSQTQFLINLYLAYYLTIILKNSVC
jgi:hypothetical protein